MYKNFRDTEELSKALAYANVSAIQISKGAFEASFGKRRIAGWCLQFIDFQQGTSACAGDGPDDDHALVVPLRVAPQSRLLGREISDRTVAIYMPGSEHADVTAARHAEVVLVPPASFTALAAVEGVALPRQGSHVFEASASGLSRLRGLLHEIEREARCNEQPLCGPEVDKSISDCLSRALVSALSPSDASEKLAFGRPRLPRSAILRRVLEILDERSSTPLYAGDLAAEVGISQASLQRVFIELFGTPPARFLLIKRFYLARKQLRDERTTTVTDVASSLGFWDLSRFSRSYRALFGESPSETQRCATVRFAWSAPGLRQADQHGRN